MEAFLGGLCLALGTPTPLSRGSFVFSGWPPSKGCLLHLLFLFAGHAPRSWNTSLSTLKTAVIGFDMKGFDELPQVLPVCMADILV